MSTHSTQPPTPSNTVSTPVILILALATFIGLRYLLSSPSSSSPSSSSSTNSSYPAHRNAQRRHIPNDKIDQVLSMFPQCSRRDVEWELRRNGGSVQGCCERVLRRGSLEGAPTSFRAQTPPLPAPASASASSGSATDSAGGIGAQASQKHPDLITRYGLASRLPASPSPASSSSGSPATPIRPKETGQKSGWSSSKMERAEMMKRRREEMILEARRRLVEKEGTGGGK